jgi:hypothetical protein
MRLAHGWHDRAGLARSIGNHYFNSRHYASFLLPLGAFDVPSFKRLASWLGPALPSSGAFFWNIFGPEELSVDPRI